MTEPRRSGVLLVPLFLLLVMVTAALPLAQPTVRPPADGGEAAPSTARTTAGTTASDASSRQTGIAQTDRPTISDATNGSTTNNDAEKQTTKQTTAADVTVKPTTSVSPDELTTVHTTGRPSQSTAGQLTTSETAEMNRVSSSTDVTGTNPTTTADKLESALPQTDDARTKPITDEPKTVLPTSDGPSATQTTAGEPRTVSAKTDVVSQETTDGGPTSQGASSEAAPAPTSMADLATSDALASDSPTADTPTSDRPTSDRPTSDRPTSDRPTSDRPTSDRPTSDRPTSDRPTSDRPTSDTPTSDTPTSDKPTSDRSTSDTLTSDTPTSDTPTSDTPTSDTPTSDTPTAAGTTGALLEIEVEESTETGTLNIDLRQPDDAAPPPATPSSTTQPPAPPHHEEDESGGVLPDDDVQQNEVLDEDTYRAKHKGPWLIGSRLAGQDDGEASLASSSTSSLSAPSLGLYRNYDVDSQERERELEERAREQNHPADLEDTNVHEVNHYVPEEEQDDEQQQLQQQKSVARWYLLLLTGNATTVRLRQKDFAKYLKLNLAARLSVEYNDLRVNRVEFKPLLMVNVTIFSRPKDNEEAPLHMLADTNATLLELSGEEYHVLRFITIPSEHQEALAALASGGIQAEYTGANTLPPRHVDVGVAVYFAIAAGLVSILLAVFLVGLCRYLRTMAAEVAWPWRRYKPIVWRLPLQHRLCADHIAHCVPMQPAVWTTADGAADVPVHKIPAPELPQLPRRLVLEPRPAAAMPPILCADPAPSTADTLLQAQPAPVQANAANACSARPNSKLSLFGEQQVVVAPVRSARQPADRAGERTAGRNRLQPQGRHPLDVRIGRRAPSSASTVLGLDNPNYMMQ